MSLWTWIMLLAVAAGLVAGLGQPRAKRQTNNGGEAAGWTGRGADDAVGSAPPEVGS
jgi:hypothetical protein